MISEAHDSFVKNLRAKDGLIVGVSGGPDSVALLRLLLSFAEDVPLRLMVAHVNHGIRGKFAQRDEQFVKKLAQTFGLPFEYKRVKLAGKTGVEEKGRMIRREFFESLAKKYHAKFIVTAHTQNDHVETIVFRFLRGSGMRGLAGMKLLEGLYLKPLLGIQKKELLAYLKKVKQSFCVDATNDDTSLSRNFIRKKILPLFAKMNPSFFLAITRSAENFRDLDDWVNCETQKILTQGMELKAKDFLELPRLLQEMVVQELYRRARNHPYGLTHTHVHQVIDLVNNRIGNKRIVCPGKVEFMLQKGVLRARNAPD